MEKVYKHTDVELKWQKHWEEQKLGKPKGQGKPYSIVVPPPNVTGTLHMGHGFQLTLMDVLVRYHRMSGYNTLWQFGTDHAGIATQMLVERKLAQANINKHDLGREKFVAEIWQWKHSSQATITKQMQAIGASMDWDRARFTLDDNYAKKVSEVFVKLYEKGLIYRGKKLVNWDPTLKTAVSDLEVINEEIQGKMWYIKYEFANIPNKFLTIATTRPETLLADQAVAVNPKDQRYSEFIGQKLKLPLCDRTIPIIADDYVEPEFGTGCVKITPAHDFNDAEVGKRHNLQAINIMTPEAKINANAPERFIGLDRFEARAQIVAELEQNALIVKTEAHKIMVPKGDRSGDILEPMLTNQWFLNCDQLAERALAIVQNGNIEFIPQNWFNTYKHWLEDIQEWCISRQLWWGHQIPAWYDSDNKCYVANSEDAVRAKHDITGPLTRDDDVLDTWFSSALWPFVTLDWQDDDSIYSTFYPTSTLVTGFDIIFFWVARMIMMGLECTENIPFKRVYFTGLIKDEKGQKMSKSKGNVIDPMDLVNGISLDALIAKRTNSMMQPQIAKAIKNQTKKAFPDGIKPHGTDALRFTYCALASNGRDIKFDINRLTGYRNFCNKLWNASRLILDFKTSSINSEHLSQVDFWILNKMQTCINESHKLIADYRFDLLAKTLYELTWHDFCDFYLEWSKVDLKINPNSQAANVALKILEQLITVLHPIMPFITEEIWNAIDSNNKALAFSEYPKQKEVASYDKFELNNLFELLTSIRNLRSELNIAFKHELELFIEKCNSKETAFLTKYQQHLKAMVNATFNQKTTTEVSATLIANSMQFQAPISEFIEVDSEIARIQQIIKKSVKIEQAALQRLNNEKYCLNAPKEQVAEYRNQLCNAQNAITKYQAYIKLIESLKIEHK